MLTEADMPYHQSAERLPQLDGLRCFAVLLVLWDHAGIPSRLHGWGDDGVRLFFVLSAFLITGILLRVRDTSVPLRGALRTFYQRRFLRILPPYYLLLGVALLIGMPTTRRDLIAHLLYVSNWRFIQVPWGPPLHHLWTLAVEEQFYLLWPLLVLVAPAKRLPWIFGGAILLAIVTRPAVLAMGMPGKAGALVTTASFDALGAGALLAWHLHVHREQIAVRRAIVDWSLLSGGILLILSVSVALFVASAPLWMSDAIEKLAATLIAVWCVERCAEGFQGVAQRALESRPVAYVGRISYGVYLVQSPIAFYLKQSHHSQGIYRGSFALFVLATLYSIVIASVSWRYFERPMNGLKRYLPYRTEGAPAATDVLASAAAHAQS